MTYIPENSTFNNYIHVFREYGFTRCMLNSLTVCIITTLITIPVSAISAYTFSRFKFVGRDFIATSLLATLMLPGAVVIIPLYLIWARLSLLNTYPCLIITYIAFSLPFSIWLLIGFFDTIPKELEEAAWIDGASRLKTLFRIVLPVVAPGLAAVAIFCFVINWQEFLFALTFMHSPDMRTVTVGVTMFVQERFTDWGAMMAASTAVLIPVLVIFRYFQKYLVAGLMAGAVKG